jgi:dipeptidyl aminopeptidase/acylaminoacyl peptidase
LRKPLKNNHGWSVVGVVLFVVSFFNRTVAQQMHNSITAALESGLSLFIPGWDGPSARFSPDGNYIAVYSERGRVDSNDVEDSLRFYRSDEIASFLAHSEASVRPLPFWVINRSGRDAGSVDEGVIRNWRWLHNSSGIAFLERTAGGNYRLVLADLQRRAVAALTSTRQTVRMFDIRDRNHYVYTASDEIEPYDGESEGQTATIAATGESLYPLLFPKNPVVRELFSKPTYHLWAVMGRRRLQIKQDGVPIVAEGDLALSPDAGSLVTELSLPNVPLSWEKLYPPPFATSAWRIRAGVSATEYVRIDLQTGSVHSLADAPTSTSAGWDAYGSPNWSEDGQAIVLPGTFIESRSHVLTRPCIAVIDLTSNALTCVETLKARTSTGAEEGYRNIWGIQFVGGDKQRVLVKFSSTGEDWQSMQTTEYRRIPDGAWVAVGHGASLPEATSHGLGIQIKQGINTPPLLVASNQNSSRVIWDPNPQLANIELGQASLYSWKDQDGRDLEGALYKPVNYHSWQRYPLVIQTHGFTAPNLFLPSGTGFPGPFAARLLSAAGFVVLQSQDGSKGCAGIATSDEGRCAAAAYVSGAKQLVADGLVDPARIGILGFSRSCFYVMEALTSNAIHFEAASITDGVMFTYMQYLVDGREEMFSEANAIIGAPPFGEGLQKWLEHSPGFHLDRVNTPLQITAEGPASLLFMWEPYAGLRYLKKPVDLIVLNTDDHVLTNPADRMASQTATVDWFRFWLQAYEDPKAAKAEQYTRWRELKKQQQEKR